MAEQPGGPVRNHPEPDLLVTLALGEVREPGRSELARHLAACEPCREEYSTVVAGLEQVLAAAPTVAPPPGFEGRVLAAIGMSMPAAGGGTAAGGAVSTGAVRAGSAVVPEAATHRGGGPAGGTGPAGRTVRAGEPYAPAGGPRGRGPTGPGGGAADALEHARRPRSRPRRRSALVVAAGAVAGLVVGAGGALLVTQDAAGPGPGTPPPTAAASYAGADLVRADGAVVGHVTGSRYEGENVLVVDVARAPQGVRYDCLGVMPDGTEVPLGSWTIGPERSATWVMADPGATAVRLVTDTGKVWAGAAL